MSSTTRLLRPVIRHPLITALVVAAAAVGAAFKLAEPQHIEIAASASSPRDLQRLLNGYEAVEMQEHPEGLRLRSIGTRPRPRQFEAGRGGTVSIKSPRAVNRYVLEVRAAEGFDYGGFVLRRDPAAVAPTELNQLFPDRQGTRESLRLVWHLEHAASQVWLELPLGADVWIQSIELGNESQSSNAPAIFMALAIVAPVWGMCLRGRPRTMRALTWAMAGHVAVCLWLPTLGYAFDVQSYRHVGSLVNNHESVYAMTSRYNYGMPWAYALGGIFRMLNSLNVMSMAGFHVAVAAFVVSANLAIAEMLARRVKPAAGVIYLTSPITLLVTGVHTQFCVVAVAVGMYGLFWLVQRKLPLGVWAIMGAAVLLGVSLWIKHVLAFLPAACMLWSRLGSLRQRLLFMAVAYGVPILGCAIFLIGAEARQGFMQNVVGYDSWGGSALLPNMAARVANRFFRYQVYEHETVLVLFKVLWAVAVIVLTAAMFRAGREARSLFAYLVAFVGLAPAIAPQYSVVALPALVIRPRSLLLWAYTAVGCIVMGGSLQIAARANGLAGLSSIVARVEAVRWREVLQGLLLIWLIVEMRTRARGDVRATTLGSD